MTRHPPAITSVTTARDGGILVVWEVDRFFEADPPEKVRIYLNESFLEIDGTETSITIPGEVIKELATHLTSVTISVAFRWNGDVPEEKRTPAISLYLGDLANSPTAPYPVMKPEVTAQAEQRTAQSPASITVTWKASNYTQARIIWGPETATAAYEYVLNPAHEQYQRSFRTDYPLIPDTLYSFLVGVRNVRLDPDRWLSAQVLVKSPIEIRSVRKFLEISKMAPADGVRAALGSRQSLRDLLFGR
ncbi:hypothetical protein [Streptomyces sp. NPDC057412]|uniref:hypothetical protein n=1 Tax=Streptomyces sp. NPDC057412 TaxID=3346123 RepID=UPI003682610B